MNRRGFLASILIALFSLVGCANTGAQYRPLVDMQGKTQADYDRNLIECQQYAQQLAGAAQQAAAGAVIGAVAGSIIMSLLGGNRYDRNQGATVGAISGGTSAGVQGETDQRNVIRRCLAGRGYSVLQ